jgi:Helix-turn-helix.
MKDREVILQVFSGNLKRCRKRQGLSQEALAFRANLHPTEWSMLERQRRMPRLDTLIRIASSLEVSPGEILQGITWQPGHSTQGTYSIASEDG